MTSGVHSGDIEEGPQRSFWIPRVWPPQSPDSCGHSTYSITSYPWQQPQPIGQMKRRWDPLKGECGTELGLLWSPCGVAAPHCTSEFLDVGTLRGCELVGSMEEWGGGSFGVAPLDLGWVSWVNVGRSCHLCGPSFLSP